MQRGAAKQISAADDKSHLYTNTYQLAYFQRHAIQHLGVYPKVLITSERLTTEFEHAALVLSIPIMTGHVGLLGPTLW